MLSAAASVAQTVEPQRNYRGFFDWDNAVGTMNYFDNTDGVERRDCQWFVGISTSHGCRFGNRVFLGAGAMLAVATPSKDMILPVFADFRYDCAHGKFTPFGDIRLGVDCDSGGLYFSPTVGYCQNLGGTTNLNFGLGLTLRGETLFTIRIGIDF